MKRLIAILITAGCFLFGLQGGSACAASISPDPDFTMTTPDGWDILLRDFSNLTHPSVSHVLDCVDDDPSQLKQIGWKLQDNKVLGAYCITYRKSGMRQAAVLLQYSKNEERDALAKQFTDTFAGEIQSGYAKRKIALTAMSADLLKAGKDIMLILDSTATASTGSFMRSSTVILHDDSLINIGTVYAIDAPESVKQALEAMPLSIKWRR